MLGLIQLYKNVIKILLSSFLKKQRKWVQHQTGTPRRPMDSSQYLKYGQDPGTHFSTWPLRLSTWNKDKIIISVPAPPQNKRSARSESERLTVHSTVASVQGQSRALGLYPQRNSVPDLSAICPRCRFNPGQPAEEGNQLGALICCY